MCVDVVVMSLWGPEASGEVSCHSVVTVVGRTTRRHRYGFSAAKTAQRSSTLHLGILEPSCNG